MAGGSGGGVIKAAKHMRKTTCGVASHRHLYASAMAYRRNL